MDEKILKYSLGCLLILTLNYAESSTKLSINENAYQYGGEYTDSESHLQYLNARYYDVETMRFISRDTYQNKSNVFDNTYNYGAGNPITNEDPSGHAIWDALEELQLPKEAESFITTFTPETNVGLQIKAASVIADTVTNVTLKDFQAARDVIEKLQQENLGLQQSWGLEKTMLQRQLKNFSSNYNTLAFRHNIAEDKYYSLAKLYHGLAEDHHRLLAKYDRLLQAYNEQTVACDTLKKTNRSLLTSYQKLIGQNRSLSNGFQGLREQNQLLVEKSNSLSTNVRAFLRVKKINNNLNQLERTLAQLPSP